MRDFFAVDKTSNQLSALKCFIGYVMAVTLRNMRVLPRMDPTNGIFIL